MRLLRTEAADLLAEALSGSEVFTLSLSGVRRHTDASSFWRRFAGEALQDVSSIVLTAKMIRDTKRLFGEARTPTQHFSAHIEWPSEAEVWQEVAEAVIGMAWIQLHLQTPEKDIYFRSPRRKPEEWDAKTTRPSRKEWALAHDEERRYALDEHADAALLQALHLADDDGIVPARRAKYVQINHFIELVRPLAILSTPRTLHIADYGCGKAYLSIALSWVLRREGYTVRLTGVDTNEAVLQDARLAARRAGIEATFVCAPIAEARVEAPDLVVALHACDTATDDALLAALAAGARAIVAAPCCHHHVNAQLRKSGVPPAVALLAHDAITRERLADLFTDSLRRDALRAHGYSAQLLEFTSPEHTTKNIMIRAELGSEQPTFSAARWQEIHAETERWHAAPALVEAIQRHPIAQHGATT